ncbi:hypothetical protein NP493_727g01037 [Ridgeia piscesae]|uniref:Uncharacterized protein n=1 Tax=Ridgeia piscesae TaxID=27915 RepID=A0AAD9NMJ7_RIDPI|nr:hypothetical protein NP493_727g01037 [Ridgeia piscesae]
MLNLQAEKDSMEEYTATEWKEELLLLEAKHQMMSVTPQMHIDLSQWTSYLDKQEFDLRSPRSENTCHLILKVKQPDDTEEFMQRSFSGQNGKIKVLDYVVPLAWRAGQPFSIAAESTIDGLARLAVAFMEGSPIVLDDLLELTEMASVTLDGRATKLLQNDSVMRLLCGSGLSSPSCQTPVSILSSIGDSYDAWGGSNESMATESDINDADSMLSAHDMLYDSDIAQTSTPNNSTTCSDGIEGAADAHYMSADSSQLSKDFSWGEKSTESEHTVETTNTQTVRTPPVSPKVGPVHKSSGDSQQSMGKPPNVLVYCGQKDSTRQFEAVKEIISKCLNSSRYAIYHLRHSDVHTVPWADNTRLLIISSEHVYDGVDAAFLKYFHQGGAVVSFTSAFDTVFVQRLQNRSIAGVLRMAFEQWTDVTAICGCHTYNMTGGSCLLPEVDVQIVATDAKTSSPIMLQVLDENSAGVAFLSQGCSLVNLDKHPAEMAVSPEIFQALKDMTPERMQILTRIFAALGMDVSQGEPLAVTPCILFAVSQAQKEKLLKRTEPRLHDGILHSRKMSLQFVDDSSLAD